MSLTAGSSVGRYQIQNLLGSGGMGEVYKAVDSTLGRPVALKVLRAELSGDPERMNRFLHEARAASALNHPNILTIHEAGDLDGSRFLVSELVEGETLRERVGRGPLTLKEILDIYPKVKGLQILDDEGKPVKVVRGLAKPAQPAVLTDVLPDGRATSFFGTGCVAHVSLVVGHVRAPRSPTSR